MKGSKRITLTIHERYILSKLLALVLSRASAFNDEGQALLEVIKSDAAGLRHKIMEDDS